MKSLKRLLYAIIVSVYIMLAFTGCGEQSIEGEWVLVKEVTSDGETLSKKDLEEEGIAETYSIYGDNVHYVLEMPLANKPVEIDFTLEKLGDDRYNFIKGNLTFATVTVKGDKMTYTVEGVENSSTMTLKRK